MKICLFLFSIFALLVFSLVSSPSITYATTSFGSCYDAVCSPDPCGSNDTNQTCNGYLRDPSGNDYGSCQFTQACPSSGNTGQDCNGGGEACGYTTVSCVTGAHCGGIGGTCNGQQLEYCIANPTPTPAPDTPTPAPTIRPTATPTPPQNQSCTPGSTTVQCSGSKGSCGGTQCLANNYKCNAQGTGYDSIGGSCSSSCSCSSGATPTPGNGGGTSCDNGGGGDLCGDGAGGKTNCPAGQYCSGNICTTCPNIGNGSGGSSGGGGPTVYEIHGTVFGDTNYNGTQEARGFFTSGEAPMSGVMLSDTYDTPSAIGTFTTVDDRSDDRGQYNFINGGETGVPTAYLRNESSIQAIPPAGYVVTTQNPVSNISGNKNQTVDFGIAKGFTISGNLYADANANHRKDAAETNISGSPVTISFTPVPPTTCSAQGGSCMSGGGAGATIGCALSGGTLKGSGSPYSCSIGICCLPNGSGGSSPAVATSSATINGAFTSPTLYPGEYKISMTPPNGYTMSWPQNGPPPVFDVIVGDNNTNTPCSVGAASSAERTAGASCTTGASAGNVINLNFGLAGQGITNEPWFQVNGLDARIDSGLANSAPSTADAACTSYTAGSGSSTAPGVLYTGDINPDFGGSQPSSTNWLVGGSLFPEIYSAGVGGLLHISYTKISNRLKQSAITPTDMTTISGCSILTDCSLPGDLANGVYKANGDLTLTGNYTFPADKNYVFLVDGNLEINGTIIVPNTSTATFITSGNITVDRSVGTTPACPPTPQVEGIFSAGKNFIIDGYNDPTTTPDNMLNIQGTIITNANLEGGSLQSNRDLGDGDTSYPAFTISGRPDFALHLPDLLKTQLRIQQEVAP